MDSRAKGLIGILLAIVAWQAIAAALNSQILPSPIGIASNMLALFMQGEIITDTASSLYRVSVGFAIGSILGITLGTLLGLHRAHSEFFTPIIELMRPIPPVAWIPISILWFGIGDLPAFFLVALGSFFPVFSNTFSAIGSVSKEHVFAAISLGAKPKAIITDIMLRSSLKSIFTGLAVGLGVSWMIVITAELVGSSNGLGYMIQTNRILLNTGTIICGMILIGIIGFGMAKLLGFAEKRFTPWATENEKALQ